MHIPRSWVRADTQVESAKYGPTPVSAWGWGDDAAAALREAEARLGRFAERVRRGDPFPQRGYDYGNRPVREEILQAMDDIYSVLVTIDYPDAMTGGLRRATDQTRGILEKTRGDLTMAIVQQQALSKLPG